MVDRILDIDKLVLFFFQENLRSGLLNAVMIFFSLIGNIGTVWIAAAIFF